MYEVFTAKYIILEDLKKNLVWSDVYTRFKLYFQAVLYEISQEIFIGLDIIFTIGRSVEKKKNKDKNERNEIDWIPLTGGRNGLDNFFTFASRNAV